MVFGLRRSIFQISYVFISTYSAELFALITHLFPYRPALRSEAVSQVDSVDGGASLLIQRGFLANPVKDLPAECSVIIQEGLRYRGKC